MEPIFQNPFFSTLLRSWKFFTTYYEYLELPQTFGEISLYEFDQHVRNEKYESAFITQLIESLVKKISGSEKGKKQKITAFYIAKQNKYNLLQKLTQTSAYELGLNEVNFALAWRNLPLIATEKSFESISLYEKYLYLSMLVDHVSTRLPFKQTYMQQLKSQYAAASQAQGRVLLDVQKKFVPKLYPSIVLGKDSQNNCYFYMSQIGDSVLVCDVKLKKWTRVVGQQMIKSEILEKIIKKEDSISNQEIDLLEQIYEIWNRINWSQKITAFDKTKKLFQIKNQVEKPNKLQVLKQKLHQLDHEYTKFLSDCYNFRWANKNRRIEYHKQIDQAKNMKDLVTSFSKFYHETKCSAQKKLITIDSYDHSLETDDVDPDQFKSIFLYSNYLYNRGVISETAGTAKYTVGLFHHIKNFLQEINEFEPYIFEYLMIFAQSMIGIVQDLYPAQNKKRLEKIRKMEEQIKSKKQKQAVQRAKNQEIKKGKLTKQRNQGKVSEISDEDASQSQTDQSQSETTVEKKEGGNQVKGRRLRQKTRIVYNLNSNSRSQRGASKQRMQKKQSKPAGIKTRRHPQKSKQTNKGSKMRFDSDDQSQEYEDQVSLSVSNSSRKSEGLNLNDYKYSLNDQDETVNFRQKLRNSKSTDRK